MTQINEQKGWKEGDALLHDFGETLRLRFEHNPIYRIFGDKFIILSPDYIDLSPDLLLESTPLKGSVITLTVTVLHLIEDNITSISKLEEALRMKTISHSIQS